MGYIFWSVALGVSTPLVQQQVILSWPDKGCHRSHHRGLVAQVVTSAESEKWSTDFWGGLLP